MTGAAARLLPRRSIRVAVVLAFVALQGVGLAIYHPCQLSYYNLLVGGLPGAERLGFEVTYWGDTVREPMLADAVWRCDGHPLLLAPSLAPWQGPGIAVTSPSLSRAGVELLGGDTFRPGKRQPNRYAVIYHRRADSEAAGRILAHGRVVGEYSIQGVWLARLVDQDTVNEGSGFRVQGSGSMTNGHVWNLTPTPYPLTPDP